MFVSSCIFDRCTSSQATAVPDSLKLCLVLLSCVWKLTMFCNLGPEKCIRSTLMWLIFVYYHVGAFTQFHQPLLCYRRCILSKNSLLQKRPLWSSREFCFSRRKQHWLPHFGGFSVEWRLLHERCSLSWVQTDESPRSIWGEISYWLSFVLWCLIDSIFTDKLWWENCCIQARTRSCLSPSDTMAPVRLSSEIT